MTEIRATQSLTRLIRPEAIAEFRLIADAPQPSSGVLERLRDADEEHELEPALMRIMGEVDATPHGPTEEAESSPSTSTSRASPSSPPLS
jgi:hypothetical protein